MFRNMKIKAKLGLGFLILLLLMSTISAVGVYSLSAASGTVSNVQGLYETVVSLLRSRGTVKDFVKNGDAQTKEIAQKGIVDLRKRAELTRGLFSDAGTLRQMDDVLAAVGKYETAFGDFATQNEAADQQAKVWYEVSKEFSNIKDELRDKVLEPAIRAAAGNTDELARWTGIRDSFSEDVVERFLLLRVNAVYFIMRKTEAAWNEFQKSITDLRDGLRKWQLAGAGNRDLESLAVRVLAAVDKYAEAGRKFQEAAAHQLDSRQQMVVSADALAKSVDLALKGQQDGLAEQASFSRTAMVGGTLVALLIGLSSALLIIRSITGPVGKGVAFAEQLARGDFSSSLDINQRDEIGLLAASLNNMADKLREVVAEVMETADTVASGSEELSASSQSMSQGATEQAASIEEVSSSMEQMSSNIAQNADNSVQTEAMSRKAAGDAMEGGKAVAQTVDAMKRIAEKISIIEEIARQTNLLALNAAIEAARAGEHGKGFAVVASEVRKLAERSGNAASEISELSVSSVRVAEQAGEMLTRIVPDIQKTAELVQEISAASREQTAGVEQINKAVQQLDSVIQQNAAASEQTASTSEALSAMAQQLQTTVSFFKIGLNGGARSLPASPAPLPALQASPVRKTLAPALRQSAVNVPVRGAAIKLSSEEDSEFERF